MHFPDRSDRSFQEEFVDFRANGFVDLPVSLTI